jgi:hypothetical protein
VLALQPSLSAADPDDDPLPDDRDRSTDGNLLQTRPAPGARRTIVAERQRTSQILLDQQELFRGELGAVAGRQVTVAEQDATQQSHGEMVMPP